MITSGNRETQGKSENALVREEADKRSGIEFT